MFFNNQYMYIYWRSNIRTFLHTKLLYKQFLTIGQMLMALSYFVWATETEMYALICRR